MTYLPFGMRLKQEGLVVKMTGTGDWRDGQTVMDFHATLGRYELEEELARMLVHLFNSHLNTLNSNYKNEDSRRV